MSMEHWCNDTDRRKSKPWDKSYLSVTLSITSFTLTRNRTRGLRSERQVNNGFSHDRELWDLHASQVRKWRRFVINHTHRGCRVSFTHGLVYQPTTAVMSKSTPIIPLRRRWAGINQLVANSVPFQAARPFSFKPLRSKPHHSYQQVGLFVFKMVPAGFYYLIASLDSK
jgi:hypothetical protein